MALNVTTEQFQNQVVNQSSNKPVLVDFWAPWCGPCRMLGPVLEKLEKDSNESWVLAKVNTDEEQQLAAQFRISGIPHCILFKDGVPVDQFTGVLPEPQLKSFLSKHVTDEASEKLKAQASSDPVGVARSLLESGKSDDESHELIWKGILKGISEDETVDDLIASIPEAGSKRSDSIKRLKNALESNSEELKKLILSAQSGNDSDAKSVMESWLNRIESEGKESPAKNLLLASFDIVENQDLVSESRKQLSRLIF